jgi:hypothetical protein
VGDRSGRGYVIEYNHSQSLEGSLRKEAARSKMYRVVCEA